MQMKSQILLALLIGFVAADELDVEGQAIYDKALGLRKELRKLVDSISDDDQRFAVDTKLLENEESDLEDMANKYKEITDETDGDNKEEEEDEDNSSVSDKDEIEANEDDEIDSEESDESEAELREKRETELNETQPGEMQTSNNTETQIAECQNRGMAEDEDIGDEEEEEAGLLAGGLTEPGEEEEEIGSGEEGLSSRDGELHRDGID
ncbi:hypothetical protein WR25_12174 [Diploscapter pachys]|uniref:Uncharacterized protein n=1 Tax=Diploscapter pachys TaxID=2018661 RepID=A0A2A2KVW8_9BILA|nr:hypothetical protein WR25_12174 [Diploscapter pachys]